MLPEIEITVSKNGDHRIEGMEQSDNCSMITELGKMAGKVTSSEKKEHQPVHQDVNRRR